jgi:hypothetical protein
MRRNELGLRGLRFMRIRLLGEAPLARLDGSCLGGRAWDITT